MVEDFKEACVGNRNILTSFFFFKILKIKMEVVEKFLVIQKYQ